ncbi:MAG TPA: S8 family serine peptidase [Flavobacteriaceae bacterium]|nr:S8 family serine peptidase [Flavobacteriaceae bacterium]
MNTKKKIGWILYLSILFGYSQTESSKEAIIENYNVERLSYLQNKHHNNYILNKRQAETKAKQLGYQISYTVGEFGRGELMYFHPSGFPVYYETTNVGSAITARVDRINSGGISGLNLDGNNMVVGVWDGGRVRSSHELLNNRAIQYDNNPNFDNHATHVTGTIIGSGSVVNGLAKGMAPLATAQNFDFNNDLSEIAYAALEGLLVSNHSYGIPAHATQNQQARPIWYLGKYTQEAVDWDEIAYEAPYLLIVKSAGNSRNQQHNNTSDMGYDLLTGSGNSKNNLVVAASEVVYEYTGPESVIMSDFSSWGPSDDGRIKPDITAKGVDTFSSIANSNNSYVNLSGTSMSAPSVSGVALLLQEHYHNLNDSYMKSATLRGLIIHTADEAGEFPGPDYQFGWGLINAEKAANVISNDGTTAIIIELDFENSEGYTLSGSAVQGQELVATIAWTDLPGNVNNNEVPDDDTPALVDDFDLRITQHSNNQTFFPWKLDQFNFTAGATRGDNTRDNVEKVEIAQANGNYSVKVTNKGVLQGNKKVSLIVSGIENYSLNTQEFETNFTAVFPNPTDKFLQVQSGETINTIRIYNVMGQLTNAYNINNSNVQLDVSHLQPGTHFLTIENSYESKTFKFLKK